MQYKAFVHIFHLIFTVQGENDGSYQGGDYSAIPGNPGADYPIYTEIPKTSFDCKQQQFPGYYAGNKMFVYKITV